MTELILVRHAQAWCNVHDVIGGPDGCRGLTERGRAQARALADRLKGEAEQADVLYSSPRSRALQTARPVGDALGLPVHIDEGLREQDFGTADGQPRSVLHHGFRGNPVLEPRRIPARGAESWVAYRTRAGRALDRLSRFHPGARLLLICHGETVNAAQHMFFGLPEEWPGPLPVTVANTGITRWRRVAWDTHRPELGTRWDLQAHNDTAHLSEPG
ncbi:histidine phosphatase family protein [Streptomyces sp. NPDC051172]|uniref:histidine phosphatase family protein n=1 Tax=Streptomyces sp. NPDC051172 TaxID=3155796 RepID=UPI00341A7FAD